MSRTCFVCALLLVAGTSHAGPVTDAERLAANGDREGATELLRDALPTLATEEEAAHAMYLLATLAPTWAEAESLHTALLDDHRESAWAPRSLIELGEHALLAANAASAHEFFDEAALHAAPGEVREQALLRDAQALLLMDQPGEARVRLNRLLDEDPSPARAERARLLLATVAYREGAYAEALRLNLDLIGVDRPYEPAALLGAARALLARGEGALASEYLDELRQGYPDTSAGAVARVLADSLSAQGVVPAPSAAADTTDAGPAPSFGSTRADVGRPAESLSGSGAAAWPPADTARDTVSASAETPIDDEEPAPDVAAGEGDVVRKPPGAVAPVPRPLESEQPPEPTTGTSPEGESPSRSAENEETQAAGYYVQLGAFANRIGALTTLSKLRRGGVTDAEIERVDVDGRRVYRVRVGPYPTRADAEADRAMLERAAEVEGSFVRRSDG